MKTNCTHCNQNYEVEESLNGQLVECQKCNKSFTVAKTVQASAVNAQIVAAKNNKGALYGCLICLIVAIIVNFCSNFLFFLWVPLYLATFILAIIAIAQRKVAWGIFALLASIIAPIVIGFINIAIGAAAMHEAINENTQNITITESDIDNDVTAKPVLKSHMPRVKGAFGIELGSVFDTRNAIGTSKLTTGEIMYQVNPNKKLRKFSKFYVLLTPQSKKIYSIWAYANFKSREADREYGVIKTLLKKKYNVKSSRGITFMGKKCSWSIDNCYILLATDQKFGKSTLELRYTNNKLSDLAKKEHLKREAANTDDSAL